MSVKYVFKSIGYDEKSCVFPSNTEVCVTFDGDCTISQLINGFKQFLLGCTFSEKLVDKYLLIEEDEYNGN